MQQNNDNLNFTDNDYKFIERLSKNNYIFQLLIKSLCPSIYGHEIVKAGLILTILGGSDYDALHDDGGDHKNKNSINFRKDCHLLLIGDPGLGKSQMLKFVAEVANRSVYVSGILIS